MNDTFRVDAKFVELERFKDKRVSFAAMTHLARTLEGELNIANKIIKDAKFYIEEFKEFPMEDGLMAILEGRIK